MLSPTLQLANNNGDIVGSMELLDAFFKPDFFDEDPTGSVGRILAGIMKQTCQEIDTQIMNAVREHLFGFGSCLDLASFNIQRARDHGIPPYNSLRVAYGLEPHSDFSQVTSNTDLQEKLAAAYDSVDQIDPWIGALAEDHIEDASVGELLATILADQFDRLMHGDKFFFLNDPDLMRRGNNGNKLFDSEVDLGDDSDDTTRGLTGIVNLRFISLARIIRRNTDISFAHNPFFA